MRIVELILSTWLVHIRKSAGFPQTSSFVIFTISAGEYFPSRGGSPKSLFDLFFAADKRPDFINLNIGDGQPLKATCKERFALSADSQDQIAR